MQAYEGALKAGDTRLLLSPNSQFFQYFNDANGGDARRPLRPRLRPCPNGAAIGAAGGTG